MVIRIASVVLSVCGSMALILGLVLWYKIAPNLVPMHMLMGLLAVGSLWVIGIGQGIERGGSWILAAVAIMVGIAMIGLGMTQSSILVGEYHWMIQVLHLLLGVLVIGIGHMSAARYRRGSIR